MHEALPLACTLLREPLFSPFLSPLSSFSFSFPPPPLLLLLLLLPSSHAVILVSEFLPRGADKKSDRKGASKGCDKAWDRGQIGRDTRRREGAQCLECRVKSMEKINTDTTFVALDKTFLKQGDRCDENATTAEGRLPDSFKLTSQLEC